MVCFCLLALMASGAETADAQNAPLVRDLAGVLGDGAQQMNDSLQAYAQKTGNRIVVCVMNADTIDEDLAFERYVYRFADENGRKTTLGNRSVYVVMRAKTDKTTPRTMIVPGEKIKDKFPSLFARHIGSDQFTGPLKDGKGYAFALNNGIAVVQSVMEGRVDADAYKAKSDGMGWKVLIAAGVALILAVWASVGFRFSLTPSQKKSDGEESQPSA